MIQMEWVMRDKMGIYLQLQVLEAATRANPSTHESHKVGPLLVQRKQFALHTENNDKGLAAYRNTGYH